MRITRVLAAIAIVLCGFIVADMPRATAQTGQASGVQTTLVNFDNAGNQAVRFDTQGNAVDAHEGQIALFGSTYYFYGTGYGCGFREYHPTQFCGFNVYSSSDLSHWVNQGTLFDATTDYWQSLCGHGQGCYRPHVIYNAHTGRYVLWLSSSTSSSGYSVLDSSSPTGPFELRPAPQLAVNNGLNSYNGDESLFVDDDGTAYLMHTDWRRQGDMVVEQLDPSYESTTGQYARLQVTYNEAPTMFKRAGRYYIMTSDPNCSFCQGTGSGYLTAPTPMGPWSGEGATPPPYWQVNNGTLVANGGGPGFSLAGSGWGDYTFSFDTQPLTTTDGGSARSGWFFRAENESGPNNSQMGGYVWSLTSNSSSTIGAGGSALVETIIQNGQSVSRTINLPFSVTASAWYHIETTAVGTAITTTVNGQVVDVTHDSTYANGRVGFIENTANGESARFKNVNVTASDGTQLIGNDFSRFDPPLAPRQTLKISTNSCGGQPAGVVEIPGENGPLYLYLSDLWSNGDMPGLSNYYMGVLSFNGDGSIAPLTCQSPVPLTLAVGSPGQQDAPADLNQSSGYDGFRPQCDIVGANWRLQTFTPSRSGALTALSFTTYQYYYGTNAPLALDVVALNSQGLPLSTLYGGTVPSATIRSAADTVTITPNVSVVAGQHYGILIHSATSQSCYGNAYNDANPYPTGQEYLSTDGGATWRFEPDRALQFTVSVSQTAPAITPTDTSVVTTYPSATASATEIPSATATPSTTASAMVAPPATASATATPTPTTAPPSMPTDVPPSPTSTSTPRGASTATATMVIGTPTVTKIVKRAPVTTATGTHKKRPAMPLTVHLSSMFIQSSGNLTVAVRTERKARIGFVFRVVTTRVRVIKRGKRRIHSTYSVVLYNVTRTGTADVTGRYTTTMRITYRPAKPVYAGVTVTAHAASHSAIWRGRVKILPPTPRSKAHRLVPNPTRRVAGKR